MAQEISLEHMLPAPAIPRQADRRCCTELAPPPYRTAEGLVLEDRRSYMDRRSSWIKEFFMDGGNEGSD